MVVAVVQTSLRIGSFYSQKTLKVVSKDEIFLSHDLQKEENIFPPFYTFFLQFLS